MPFVSLRPPPMHDPFLFVGVENIVVSKSGGIGGQDSRKSGGRFPIVGRKRRGNETVQWIAGPVVTVVASDLFIYASTPCSQWRVLVIFFYPVCCCASVEMDQKKKLPAVVFLGSTNHRDRTEDFTQQTDLT